MVNDDNLRQRARRAYELGRLWRALWPALVVPPMAALSLGSCGRPAVTLTAASLLLLSTVALSWRGEALGDAVAPGLLSGIAPLLMPLVLCRGMHPCQMGFCWSAAAPFCVLGGLVAGVAVGLRSARAPLATLAATALVAALTGALGCLLGGAAGLSGMAIGLVAGAAPVVMHARRRAG
jgi:hypothetical protein